MLFDNNTACYLLCAQWLEIHESTSDLQCLYYLVIIYD